MLFYNYRQVGETVDGFFEDNTQLVRGMLRHIYVKAENSSTIFDLILIDKDSDEILKREAETGELNELLTFPLHGIYTIQIKNSTADEDFIIKFLINES